MSGRGDVCDKPFLFCLRRCVYKTWRIGRISHFFCRECDELLTQEDSAAALLLRTQTGENGLTGYPAVVDADEKIEKS